LPVTVEPEARLSWRPWGGLSAARKKELIQRLTDAASGTAERRRRR
jgi:phenylpyruvate tautomerase PptA (4-oxalocrotonate tautomerase family)